MTAVHLLFWAIVGYLFLENSFLRLMHPSLWVELCALLCMVVSFYVTYFVLVPKLLISRRFVLFFVCTLLLVLLSGYAEFCMVEKNEMAIYSQIDGVAFDVKLRLNIIFFLCLRNACFIIVGDIAKLCELQAIQLQQNNKATIEITGHILVNIPSKLTALLDISEICYLKYSNRKTTIYRHSSYPVATYTSLNYFEENLPVHQFIRINRNVLVAYSAIQYYNDEAVFVLSQKTMVSFPFCNSNSENTLAQLEQWDSSKYHPLNSLTQNNL